MIGNLFSMRYVSIQAEDWDSKKSELKSFILEEDFERRGLAQFETDRHNNDNRYFTDFCRLFGDEINRFGVELGLTQISIGHVWSVRYQRGDYHAVHNHRSTGYSGILYVDFDEEVHSPSIHVSPWNDPITDFTQYSSPPVKEGTMVFVPSSVLHFTRPNNSDKLRSIVAFDMEVQ